MATTVSQVSHPLAAVPEPVQERSDSHPYLLIGAAGLAALIGNVKDASVILAVVVINALVGFYQEYRAELSLAALRKMPPLRTDVRRDAKKLDIDADALVPGDVVLLEAGDHVPADGRLIVAANLDIEILTNRR